MEFDNGRASSSGHGKANSNASDDKGDGDANVEANYNASDAEGDSDANTEDQHGNDIVEEQEREVQPSQPPGRCQRKRKVAKWPSDKIVVTELTEDGMPTEDKAQKRMRKLAGLIARQRLSLMLPSFNYLTEEEKEELYVDSVQQWLEFADDVKDTAWKMMMRIINKSWRTHKSSLVTNFVRKGLNARTKHPYIGRREWADFVELHNSEEAKEKSETYKKLRERNKQNHCLGTTGYAGKAEKWKQEDSELAAKGISNPWHKFPEGRPRSYLRGRGKLVISEFSAEIHWSSKSAESISQKILEKQAELDSSGVTAVRDKDVLTQVLGQPEQTGRMRGVSSYSGWKHWPNCTSMYRKRKHSDIDVEAIKVEVANYIFDMLREHGVKLDLPSNTPPFVVGLKSSCASVPDEVPYASACNNVQLDRVGGTSYPNLVDLITEPKLCTLVIKPGDNQVEVGKGTVFPPQAKLYSVPVLDKNAVVLVSFINPGHEGIMLTPPTGDVTTFGQAMFKRVQWRKDGIVITDQVPTKSSLGPTLLGRSANHSLNDLVSNVSSSQVYKVKSAPAVGNCASKEHAEDKKQTNESTRSSIPPRAPTKSNIKRDQQVGVNQQQEEEEAKPTKLSKITPVASLWVRPNSMFNFGQPILSVEEVEKAGPWCAALHAHYMKACAENRNTGIVGTMDRQYFLREVRYEPLTVGFEDLFDLLRLDALDVALLRVMTLCLIVEARDNSVPVALLDPDALSIITLNSKRSYSVAYLERCLKKYAQKKYVMFAHNCGGHWIVVIIVPNWQKVLYLDSNRGMKTDLRGLKSVIDEAYGNIQPKAKKEQTKVKLSHATKIPCLQQGLDNTCGFFVAHNLMRAMAQANLDNSEDFDFLSVPISLGDIREKISMFIMSQIVEEEGEFYDPASCK